MNRWKQLAIFIPVVIIALFMIAAAVTTVGIHRPYQPTSFSGYVSLYYRDTFQFDSTTRFKPRAFGCTVQDVSFTNVSTSACSLWVKFQNQRTFDSDTNRMPIRLLHDSTYTILGVPMDSFSMRGHLNNVKDIVLVEAWKVN